MSTTRILTSLAAMLGAIGLQSAAWAIDHTRSVGEPYALAGKRMVFTNWYFIRPGQLDWKDSSGKSVYASGEFEAGPDDAHFDIYLAPRGIRIVAEPAQRGQPIIRRQMPWEKMGISGNCLIHENGKYRLWAGAQEARGKSFGCYFESTDGKTWIRPSLGLIEYNGSKDNNLYQAPGGYIFVDPHAPPAERYKSIWAARTDPRIIQEYRKRRPISVFAEEEDPGRFHSIRAAVSPDGFNWTELTEPISVEVSDTQIIAYFDEQLNKYIMFTRTQLLGPRAPGAQRPEGRMHDFIARRAIGRSETDNFREFPLSELIIQPGADMAPTDTFYTNCKTTIPGAPDHHLLFPAIYHQADDTTSIEIWSSDNTKNWTRIPGSPVLKTNTPGQWDGGCIFAHPSLVELPDGSWVLPYTGYVYPHKYPRGAWGYDVGLAIWPKGRLVALEAPEHGEFTTVAFVPPGKQLLINAVTQRAGSILIEACDVHANPLPQRSFAQAKPIIGDHFRTPVTWQQADDLGIADQQPIVLRFKLDKARIYGLEFE